MTRRDAPRVLAAAALGLCASCAAGGGRAEPGERWQDVERVVAFADVHGAYAELTELLRAASVIDAGLRWSGGRTHLVSLGDLLDRGDDSRKVMDLLMRLQSEAQAAGGAVHVVLGNHEAMNVLGDLRYVTPGEYAAFAAGEPEGARRQARGAWLAGRGPEAGADFDARFPPGWFGHRAAFAPDGPYGRWLLGRPAAIVIGDTLFMHGGPSSVLAGLSLEEINLRYRAALSEYLAALAPLAAAGLVGIEDAYAERAEAARQRLAAQPSAGPDAAAALGRFAAADGNPMLGLDGPNWYRGAALCRECSESDVLLPVLERLGAKRLVVGHTVARDGRVASRFDGAVIRLDAGMNRAVYGGRPAALVLERGEARVRYAQGVADEVIPAEPLTVAPADRADADVAALLAAGTVTVAGPRAPGVLNVLVEAGGQRAPAVFVAAGADARERELAAYRLDRVLGLGLVPATVEREVQGRRGYLQARPGKWLTQAELRRQSLQAGGWCALGPQFELVYAFDALIGNAARTEDALLYDASEWRVLLTAHERAFGTGRALPAHRDVRPPGRELRRRLAALDDAGLAAALGDLLGARARGAILQRRDGLVETAIPGVAIRPPRPAVQAREMATPGIAIAVAGRAAR
jgi:hypothetical protein